MSTSLKKGTDQGLGETGSAVAIGVALAVSVSLAVGLTVGTALWLFSVREKKPLTLAESVRVAGIAIGVGMSAEIAISVLNEWDTFKAGFMQGWHNR